MFRLLSSGARDDLDQRDSAKSMEDLRTSRSVLGHHLSTQTAQNETDFCEGRQIGLMIFDDFRPTSIGKSILDVSDLLGVALR